MSTPPTSSTPSTPPAPRDALAGTWRLLAYEVEVRATGERFPAMGARPTGYTHFSRGGRVWFLLTGDGRPPGEDDAARADLLETLIAYTGRYRIEGDDWITAVDVAWNPAWVGTEQRRQFALDGDRLEVRTPWRVMPNWAEYGETRSLVTFERDDTAP